jgi:hypothetical protein
MRNLPIEKNDKKKNKYHGLLTVTLLNRYRMKDVEKVKRFGESYSVHVSIWTCTSHTQMHF